ncbi:branched-chain amino acid ABC transporter permease [Fodinicurvata sp. EGI_FJ10296]|uniref:branched-chain amino acid ABC transporter permease n=1 Tax=Fodinicurvata sp. EGI_FJ10296 TaxID=3231908 RepID=UPI003455AAF8
MAGVQMRPAGDFRTGYGRDTTIFDDRASFLTVVILIAIAACAPLLLSGYGLNLMIQIGYLGIAALGLNILVGFTGQISIGHSVFFGFGAFASVFIHQRTGIPVFFCIPLAGCFTAAIGLIFGIPAARIKGLYLAIATLAAQFILQDFFARASWFTGGVAGTLADPVSIFGYQLIADQTYFYLVLAYVVVMYVLAANLMRTRDGRALIAVRDHYLSAEIMGVNLTKYRILSFGISSFYAGIGGALYAHYLGFVSVEAFTILFSIQFLGMIIIGGLGSIMGTLMGTAFMVLLPETMDAIGRALTDTPIDTALSLRSNIAFLQEMAIGLAIVLFLIFEPDGLAHRWRQIKAYWKLYPFSY